MDALPWPNIGVGSGWLFVGLFVWLVFTGRLVPRATLEDKIHEANEWRTEGRIKDQQLAEKDIQLRHMEEVGTTVNAVMRALQALLRRSRIEEGDL